MCQLIAKQYLWLSDRSLPARSLSIRTPFIFPRRIPLSNWISLKSTKGNLIKVKLVLLVHSISHGHRTTCALRFVSFSFSQKPIKFCNNWMMVTKWISIGTSVQATGLTKKNWRRLVRSVGRFFGLNFLNLTKSWLKLRTPGEFGLQIYWYYRYDYLPVTILILICFGDSSALVVVPAIMK